MRTNAAHNASYIRDDAAFERYLDVVNRTLVEVGDRFPYHALIGSFARALAGRPLVISITGASAKDETSIGCVLDGLTFRLTPIDATTPATRWRLDRDHIAAVVAEPWRYLADPSRLELPPFNLVGASGETPSSMVAARRRHAHASRP